MKIICYLFSLDKSVKDKESGKAWVDEAKKSLLSNVDSFKASLVERIVKEECTKKQYDNLMSN